MSTGRKEGKQKNRYDWDQLPITGAHGNLPPGLYGRSPSNAIFLTNESSPAITDWGKRA